MSASLEDLLLDSAKNPQLLQSYILDKFQESTDNKFAIVDGNNPTAFLIEGFSSIAAQLLRKVDDTVIPLIYPSRATSVTDLYRHLPDYGYIGLFATPAMSKILMIVDKGYLMRHAVEVEGATYKKVVIPETTKFTIGAYTFGLYYPIEIRVSPATGMFTVMYDTSKSNPLHVLTQNILEYAFHRHDSMNYAYITIPVYQFNTTTVEEPLVNGSGYRREIPYTDQFYAIKCHAEVRDPATDTWKVQELPIAPAGRAYDPSTPTVVFSVDPASKLVIAEIPYVYFMNNLVRGNLRVDVYTTAGELNYQVPSNTEELVSIDMFSIPLDAEVQKYAEPFRTMPALGAIPVSMQISGGTNGMSYDELRRRVISGAYGQGTLQTPADVDAYFANEGYVTSLYKDGITDRIFNAHVAMKDVNGDVIAAASMSTLFDLDALLKSNTRTIISPEANVYTILPSTRYRLDPDKGICVPLTDSELDQLDKLLPGERVKKFNDNAFTLCPFHLQISTKYRYPVASVYDMTDSEIESREFLVARDIDKHLSLNSAKMEVVPVDKIVDAANVTDKYRFTFRIIRSGLDNTAVVVPQDNLTNIRVLVGIKKLDGSFMFADATYNGRVNDIDEFRFEISAFATFIEANGERAIRLKSPFPDDGADVYLTAEARVILCLRSDLIEDDKNNSRYLETDFTRSKLEDIEKFKALGEHRMTIRFGKCINELNPNVSPVFSGINYLTYKTTSFIVNEAPVYKTDANGVPTYTMKDGHVVFDELAPAGSLKSCTKLVDQLTLVTSKLKSNLSGCEYYDPSTGATMVFPSEDHWNQLNSSLEGEKIAVNARCVPKFTIGEANLPVSDDSPTNTVYELADAIHAKGFSSSRDKWIGGKGEHIYEIKADSALKVIYETYLSRIDLATGLPIPNEFNVFDGTGNPDFLSTIDAKEGKFVLIEHDASSNEPAVKLVEADEGVAKLYYFKNGMWNCLMSCDSFDKLSAIAYTCLDNVKNEDGLTDPIFYGYVYIISDTNNSAATSKYISWLTQSNGVPDLSPLRPYKYDDGVAIDDDFDWKNKVNTYPFEVEVWNKLDPSGVKEAGELITTFNDALMLPYIEHKKGQVRLNSSGRPIEDTESSREVHYLVNMIQVDAKLAETTEVKSSHAYPGKLVEMMRGHFSNLGGVKNRLYTNTKLFFEPMRSLGYGKFYTDGDNVTEYPLDIRMGFRLHVTPNVVDDTTVTNSMRAAIIDLIDAKISQGTTNLAEIAKQIKDENSDSVKWVDVLGIDGDPNLQTMHCVDSEVRPHLKHELKLMEDGSTIDLDRGLDLEFVVAQ